MSIRFDDLGSAAELPEDALDDIVGGKEIEWHPCVWLSSSQQGQTIDRRDVLL
ncbi:hypothetical protein [Microbispora sp. H10670]|uniref:hypothetical protein n=1 Tax=Microbispora sp. H10670 TaxID=2729108 RepID=UPI0016016C0F|nr:hypothetical protein [Microbispora sp. H10670]